MNDGRFERYEALATLDFPAADNAKIDLVRCLAATVLPCRVDIMERHPLGSQAFIPLSPFSFFVVVALGGEELDPGGIEAFVTNGRQGINYHRGTWHMPMIGTQVGQSFVVVDRAGHGDNVECVQLDEALLLMPEPVSL